MINIAIFVSGNGSNCENIIRHFAESKLARVALVVSNIADAFALERAKRLGVPTLTLSKADFANQEYTITLLDSYNIEFIVLAGFLMMVPDYLISRYHQRIINIHPALLPHQGAKVFSSMPFWQYSKARFMSTRKHPYLWGGRTTFRC